MKENLIPVIKVVGVVGAVGAISVAVAKKVLETVVSAAIEKAVADMTEEVFEKED